MYYLISFIYKQITLYCIWVSDDKDYIITKNDKILFFNTLDKLSEYVKKEEMVIVKSEEVQYNLDKMILWCYDESNVNCGCDEILNMWNICIDVANSTKKHFIGNDNIYDSLYEKIFFANNLFIRDSFPCSTLSAFSDADVENIKKILMSGINLILENIMQ